MSTNIWVVKCRYIHRTMYVPIILANNHKYEKCKYCFFSRYGVLSSALGDSWNFQTNLKLFFCTLRQSQISRSGHFQKCTRSAECGSKCHFRAPCMSTNKLTKTTTSVRLWRIFTVGCEVCFHVQSSLGPPWQLLGLSRVSLRSWESTWEFVSKFVHFSYLWLFCHYLPYDRNIHDTMNIPTSDYS